MSREVPHLRSEKGCVSCHSSGSLEGCCSSLAEVIEDTEDFFQFDRLYSLFSAVERFLYLRDFFCYFDRFFNLCLRDFLNEFFNDI